MALTDTLDQEFRLRLRQTAQAVEDAIETYMALLEPAIPQKLRQAMLYSLRAGGKRLRPVISIFACRACRGLDDQALPAAAAVEIVHTYSLIHDDLPAMDDDDLRRGRPSNHKVFGEGVAILAGDALLTYAFHILAQHVPKASLSQQLVMELSQAAGAAGMIGGQIEDLLANSAPGTVEKVDYIHTCKTAMLLRAAARMGALCADADQHQLEMLGDYGLKLGLAFQITDDLLDVTSTTQQMGKPTQKDHKAGKLTYPAVAGIEQSNQKAQDLIDQALAALADFDASAEPLRQLARMIIKRRN
ncbi:polyprenyl synthetase family protein [Planctomycetota bacterium]